MVIIALNRLTKKSVLYSFDIRNLHKFEYLLLSVVVNPKFVIKNNIVKNWSELIITAQKNCSIKAQFHMSSHDSGNFIISKKIT